jgi:hypothetical protein
MRRTIVILTLVTLAAAGCMDWSGRAASEGSPPLGAIRATVRLEGGPAPGHRLMKGAAIEVLAGPRLVERVRTDRRGRFAIALAPGRYRFRLQGGPNLLPPKALVTAAQTTRVTLILNAK